MLGHHRTPILARQKNQPMGAIRLFIFSLAISLPGLFQTASAQGSLVAEIVQVHDGVQIPELAGFTTYRIYYVDPTVGNFVSTMFGNPDPTALVACPQPFGFSSFTGNLYQHPLGQCLPVNCALNGIIPGIAFDSWFTIGYPCEQFGQNTFLLQLFSNPSNFCSQFEAGNPGQLIEGGFVTVQDFSNGFIQCGHKLLIAQFTTNGSWTFCVNIQGQLQGQPNLPNQFNTYGFCNLCVSNTDAIPAYPDDFVIQFTEGNACLGESSQIEFSYILPQMQSAVGTNFQLFSTANPGVPVATGLPPYTNVPPGTYFVSGTAVYPNSNFFPNNTCTYISNEVVVPDTGGSLVIGSSLSTDQVCDGIVTITLTASGGIEPYSYSLDGGVFQASPIFSGVNCQNYTVVVLDDNGCEGQLSVQPPCSSGFTYGLNVNFDPCSAAATGSVTGTITATPGPISAVLNGPGGVQNFNGNSPLPVNVSNLVSGAYTIQVTDGNGCSDLFEFVIPVSTPFSAEVEATPSLCFEQCSGAATAIITGGVGNISFTWDGTAGSNTIQNLCPGAHILVATDQLGCSQTVNFQVGQPQQLVVSSTVTPASCNGSSDGQISATAVGGTPGYQFSIGGAPQASGLFTGLTAQSYTITATDANGCVATQTVQITQPAPVVLTASGQNVTCAGLNNGIINATITGGAPTGTYTLTPGGISQSTGQFSGLAPGTYTIGYTDSNGCQATNANVVITEPTPLVVTVVGTTPTACGGECSGSVELSIAGGTAPYTVLFNGQVIAPGFFCVGNYTAVVTDSNGCTSSVQFEISGPDPLLLAIITQNVTCTGMCDGSSLVNAVGGVPPYAFSFSQPCAGQLTGPGVLSNLCEGVCSVTVTDSQGCSETGFIIVNADIVTDMELFMFNSPVTCWNQQDGTATVMVTGGNLPISYEWNDPVGQITATAIGLSEETYQVTVTDNIGCTLTSSVVVETTIGCFFIANVLTPNGDGMNDTWLIGGLEYFPNSVVKVFNRWGQVMFESRGYTVPWDGSHNGQRLPVADYYFVIDYESGKEPILGTVTIKY
jgi:gliding motility-associated-like protein